MIKGYSNRIYDIKEVFHFIGSSVPAKSQVNIIDDIEQNLISTINLLEIIRNHGVNKITYLSSAGTMYSNYHTALYQEDDLVDLTNSYGIVKSTIENYIKLYNRYFNINYLILRVSNPFGLFHRSNENGFINIAFRNIISNKPLSIWGDGNLKKDYIFSVDLAKIFWDLFKLNICNTTVNLGSGKMLSINEIISEINLICPNIKILYEKQKVFDAICPDIKIERLKSLVSIELTPFSEALKLTLDYEYDKYNSFNIQ